MQCIHLECTAFLLIKYTLLKNDLNFQLFQVTIQQILHLYIVSYCVELRVLNTYNFSLFCRILSYICIICQ